MENFKDSLRVWRGLTLVPVAVFVCWVASANRTVSGFADEYVVIANKANPVDSISTAELKKIFLGETSTWANGSKVTAIVPGPDRPEYSLAIKKATGMSGADFKRYFIQASFVGKTILSPKTLDTTAAIARFISTSTGAIACVPVADAGAGVKILKVK